MDHFDAIGDILVHALAGHALEHHDDWRGQPARCRHVPNLHNKLRGRLGPIPPPAGGTGTNDIRCVDEKHRKSVARLTVGGAGAHINDAQLVIAEIASSTAGSG